MIRSHSPSATKEAEQQVIFAVQMNNITCRVFFVWGPPTTLFQFRSSHG
jgi:hypothetical protein